MLMEQLEYNLLFRWFVGLSANEPVWHPTVFSKNRERLVDGVVSEEFFSLIKVDPIVKTKFGPQ
jgi:transposase